MSLWHLREKTVITLLVSILLFSTGCSTGSLPADSKEQPAAETGGEPEQNAPPETPPDSSQTEPVVFFDAVFERLVKKELGKEEIFPADLESFTSISVASDEFLFLAASKRDFAISMKLSFPQTSRSWTRWKT